MELLLAAARPRRRDEHSRVKAGNASALGVAVPDIRRIAKLAGKDHALAAKLWASGVHEARQLAAMVDDPALVTEEQAEAWVAAFDSWDLCDGVFVLFEQAPFAWQKAFEWAEREEEFVKRAGFVLVAGLAVHDKRALDDVFLAYLPVIRRHANDERNFVKKAVNWTLRQIGKRNEALRQAAMSFAEEIQADGTRSGRWIAADALRELRNPKGMAGRRLAAARAGATSS